MTAEELKDAAARLLFPLSTDPPSGGLRYVADTVQVSTQLLDQAEALNRAAREWRPPDYPLVWEGDQA